MYKIMAIPQNWEGQQHKIIEDIVALSKYHKHMGGVDDGISQNMGEATTRDCIRYQQY